MQQHKRYLKMKLQHDKHTHYCTNIIYYIKVIRFLIVLVCREAAYCGLLKKIVETNSPLDLNKLT